VQGKIIEEGQQDVFLCVVDATNLKLHLGLVMEMIELGRPILLVLNMMDEARRRGMQINTQKLSERLGVNVVETVAVRNAGVESLINSLDQRKFDVPHTELSGLSGSTHQKITHILKDVVNYIDEEDLLASSLGAAESCLDDVCDFSGGFCLGCALYGRDRNFLWLAG